MRKSRKKSLAICAVLSLLSALVSFGFFVIQDGGALTIRADFDLQIIPFTMALHNQIIDGGLTGWCWNLDLGASAVQGFGYYGLGSPFFWTSMLFPTEAFPYVVCWLYVAKYVVASCTAHLFLRRFVGNPNSATIGALLYAFSGFSSANLLFYIFHDVVALFPLMLIGLERMMEDKRDWIPFTLSVTINCLVNYFFFVQSTVFLLLYYAFRFGPTLWRNGPGTLFKSLVRCLALGMLGVGMAAILLVPSALYVRQNPRVESTLSLGNLIGRPKKIGTVVEGILLPASAMHNRYLFSEGDYSSTACWLPAVGISLAIAYGKRRSDWLTKLLVVLLVFSFSPVLSSSFLLFSGSYHRWWYTLVLMLALATTKVVDKPRDYDIRFGVVANAILIAVFFGVVHVFPHSSDSPVIRNESQLVLYTLIAIAGLAVTLLATSPRHPGKATLAIATVTFCVVSTATTLYWYRVEWRQLGKAQRTHDYVALGTQLEQEDPQYRYATASNQLTLTGSAAGTSAFSSTISIGSGQLESLMGSDPKAVFHLNKEKIPGLSELLGGRYQVSQKEREGANPLRTYSIYGRTYYVYDSPACPIGLLFDQYCMQDDVLAMEPSDRPRALMTAPVISANEESLVSSFAQKVLISSALLDAPIDELVAAASTDAVTEFQRDVTGFKCSANTPKKCIAYFAVPYDDGWTALVNGKTVPIVNSGGMMLIALEPGQHAIEFRYVTPGVMAGLVVSIASLAIFVTSSLLSRRSKPSGRGLLTPKE